MADIPKKEKTTTKITCIVTGRSTLFSNEYYQKRVQGAGGEELLRASYCCKQAKKLLLKGHTVKETRSILGVGVDLDEISPSILAKIIGEKVEEEDSTLRSTTKPHIKEFILKLQKQL